MLNANLKTEVHKRLSMVCFCWSMLWLPHVSLNACLCILHNSHVRHMDSVKKQLVRSEYDI